MCSLKSVNVFLALKANLCKIFFSFELEGFFSGFFFCFFFFFLSYGVGVSTYLTVCWCMWLVMSVHVLD